MSGAKLTLGPVLFLWSPAVWRDFHFRVADEAPVDEVYVGDIVCSKRSPAIDTHLGEVIERLERAGKRVIRSTPILPAGEVDRARLRDLTADETAYFEANDLGAVSLLTGRPHAIGPFVNVYNEGTLNWLAARGAKSITLNAELPEASIAVIAAVGASRGVAIETQVFGRMPLAISARCYHARAHGLPKDDCRHVCGRDHDGMAVETMDAQPFLAVNGTQTLSHGCLNLAGALSRLRNAGVTRFRLLPQSIDMVRVARTFRDALDGAVDEMVAAKAIDDLAAPIPTVDGFLFDRAGAENVRTGE